MQEATIQVRQRGTLTLPAELRQKYGIQPGDTYHLVDLGGILILTPMVPMVPELAREIERMRLDAGLRIDELLGALREQRKQYTVGERSAKDEPKESNDQESDDIAGDA
jgi:bifunctional DNA-binding transcriptional regulator/antitoxin component of YhaV-PrlF toxin-antitoxin module